MKVPVTVKGVPELVNRTEESLAVNVAPVPILIEAAVTPCPEPVSHRAVADPDRWIVTEPLNVCVAF